MKSRDKALAPACPRVSLPAMRPRRTWNKLTRGLRRGLLSAAAISFIVGAVGVPLPVALVKDRSVAFPCMHRSCGCHDAADCKKHCCCFSSEEKLAWSDEHGVDPTPFVADDFLAALPTKISHEPGCHTQGTSHLFAIVASVMPACVKGSVSQSCCAKKAAEPGSDLAHRAVRHRGNQMLTIAAYRQCTGLASLWTLVHAALPPSKPVQCEFRWFVTGRVVQQTWSLATVCFTPPTPPPRA